MSFLYETNKTIAQKGIYLLSLHPKKQKDMTKRPKQLTVETMQDVMGGGEMMQNDNWFMNSEVGIMHGSPDIFRRLMMQDTPFAISDHRMGLIERGEVHAMVDLVERRLTAGTVAFIGPGTIVQPLNVSSDLVIKGLVLFPSFTLPFATEHLPTAFNGQTTNFQLHVEGEEFATASLLLDTMWEVACHNYHRPTFAGLVMAVMNHWSHLYEKAGGQRPNSSTNERDIFDRFVRLVNRHATQQHQISFYADHLCLTERYLGTIVRQASGSTAKEWIDRALVTRAKILLRHSDKTVVQISDELCFPNPSFFSKYFRRLTGMTPLEYKRI